MTLELEPGDEQRANYFSSKTGLASHKCSLYLAHFTRHVQRRTRGSVSRLSAHLLSDEASWETGSSSLLLLTFI